MRPMVLLFVALFNSILGLSVLFPIFGPLGRALELSETPRAFPIYTDTIRQLSNLQPASVK